LVVQGVVRFKHLQRNVFCFSISEGRVITNWVSRSNVFYRMRVQFAVPYPNKAALGYFISVANIESLGKMVTGELDSLN
jgi:hypothetical protein